MIYNDIISKHKDNRKQLAVLVDPDKIRNGQELVKIVETANNSVIDIILVGGSLISNGFDNTVNIIKENSTAPVLLFPGSLLQISDKADGILMLSLISGRNPELLIGNHVVAAPLLKNSSLEIISTGYMIIETGKQTSVEYLSNTKPIPFDKKDIAVATAMAGEMLGMKMIYLEAGSGASRPICNNMISEVKRNITIPLIVGGGIRNKEQISGICRAGADIVVVGTALEENLSILPELASTVHAFN